MARHHATLQGNIPFTPEEEAEADLRQQNAHLTTSEPYSAQLRYLRDQALKASDWRASNDLVLSTEWKEYRQALRDLPQQPGFPYDYVAESGELVLPSEPGNKAVIVRS